MDPNIFLAVFFIILFGVIVTSITLMRLDPRASAIITGVGLVIILLGVVIGTYKIIEHKRNSSRATTQSLSFFISKN